MMTLFLSTGRPTRNSEPSERRAGFCGPRSVNRPGADQRGRRPAGGWTAGGDELVFTAGEINSNAEATGLLIVEGRGPGGGILLRWHGTGTPQAVTGDVIVAAR